MIWATAYLPVPRVVTLEQLGWHQVLVTEALRGRDATDPSGATTCRAPGPRLGQGLRRFHEAVGEEWCPFRFDLDHALDHVARRVENGVIARPASTTSTPASPRRRLGPALRRAPDVEDLVVCHGDYCAPNVLLEDGRVTGYVDLGELGVADRWWDVAVGAGAPAGISAHEHEARFYEGYGIEPDPGRIRFYRLLYDLVS